MRWYLSHPTSDAGSRFEAATRAHFSPLGLDLETPNAALHQTGYARLGIAYLDFALAVLPLYDGCVAVTLPLGRWSHAVAQEVNWFIQHERPVFRLLYTVSPDDNWSFTLALIAAPIAPADICSVAETRALVRYYRARPHAGRSYAELDHCPSQEEISMAVPESEFIPSPR
jgi:hypothetical protein